MLHYATLRFSLLRLAAATALFTLSMMAAALLLFATDVSLRHITFRRYTLTAFFAIRHTRCCRCRLRCCCLMPLLMLLLPLFSLITHVHTSVVLQHILSYEYYRFRFFHATIYAGWLRLYAAIIDTPPADIATRNITALVAMAMPRLQRHCFILRY